MTQQFHASQCSYWHCLHLLRYGRTSLVAQTVKRLSTMQETRVRALDWEDPLGKEMAIHSSTIAWKISWTEEPGRLQSMESQRVGHDWVTSLHRFDPWVRKIPWSRAWQPTPVFLPGESHGRRSLVGYSPWSRKELDTTEWLHFHFYRNGRIKVLCKEHKNAWGAIIVPQL